MSTHIFLSTSRFLTFFYSFNRFFLFITPYLDLLPLLQVVLIFVIQGFLFYTFYHHTGFWTDSTSHYSSPSFSLAFFEFFIFSSSCYTPKIFKIFCLFIINHIHWIFRFFSFHNLYIFSFHFYTYMFTLLLYPQVPCFMIVDFLVQYIWILHQGSHSLCILIWMSFFSIAFHIKFSVYFHWLQILPVSVLHINSIIPFSV